MKKILAVMTLAIAAIIFALPSESSAQGRGRSMSHRGDMRSTSSAVEQPGRYRTRRHWERVNDHGRHRYRGRNRYTYGYRNYGQYRRTQVGNRRFRMVRRYYTRDGVRASRWVRVYY